MMKSVLRAMRSDPSSVSVVGYGVSSKAVIDYFQKRGINPTVRVMSYVPNIPLDCQITENYLDTTEELVFRSPAIRPDKIKHVGTLSSEIALALSLLDGYKIGVTGSDGKTTTSTLIYNILKRANKSATLCGNIGKSALETVDSSDKSTFTVCELSSFQLFDMTPSLDTAIITNITQNHLDWHTDMREYITAKRNILINARHLVLDFDSEVTRNLANGLESKKITLFSSHTPTFSRESTHAVYIKQGVIYYDRVPIIPINEIGLRGDFNVKNVQCAISSCVGLCDISTIREECRAFKGVSGRMSEVLNKSGVTYIDSAIDTTPARTISTLSAFEKSKTIAILGGYDKNLDYECLYDAVSGIKLAVLCGQSTGKIYKAISGACDIRVAHDLESATKIAIGEAKSGDFVILSPASASFDEFKNYKEKSEKFKQIVKETEQNDEGPS